MEKQALKRNGKVELNSGRPTLHVETTNGKIELSLLTLNDEIYREHSYARFRVEQFADKRFVVMLKSEDLLFKPLPVGNRFHLPDEQFNERYIVAGNDAEFVQSVLTPAIRDRLRSESLQVSFGRRSDAAMFDRETGWLSVQTQFFRTGDEVFDALIETAILFQKRFDALREDVRVKSSH